MLAGWCRLLQRAEEILDALGVDAEVAPAFAGARPHVDQAALSGRPHLNYKIIQETKERCFCHSLKCHRIHIHAGNLPAWHGPRCLFDERKCFHRGHREWYRLEVWIGGPLPPREGFAWVTHV